MAERMLIQCNRVNPSYKNLEIRLRTKRGCLCEQRKDETETAKERLQRFTFQQFSFIFPFSSRVFGYPF